MKKGDVVSLAEEAKPQFGKKYIESRPFGKVISVSKDGSIARVEWREVSVIEKWSVGLLKIIER